MRLEQQPIITENNAPSSDNISALLTRLFPEQEYREKAVKRTIGILGELTNKLSADEIQTIVVETEYLCESLLDVYERQLFEGKTLNELLNEG